MANDPQLTLSVLADIKGLQTGMQQAETVVSSTSDKMKRSIDSVDMGVRFQKQAQMATRAMQGITSAIETINKAQGDAIMLAEGLSQSMMMTGNRFAAIGGAAMQAGMAISEFFTGAQAEARKELERLSGMEQESRYRAETRDLERQLEILKETDPIRKIELEGQRELARIRAAARKDDESDAARARTAAEEALSTERTRLRVEEARKQAAKDAISAPEGVIDTITTSIGGAFRIAQRGAMSILQQKATDAAEKTAENTRAMLDFMRRGAGVIA